LYDILISEGHVSRAIVLFSSCLPVKKASNITPSVGQSTSDLGIRICLIPELVASSWVALRRCRLDSVSKQNKRMIPHSIQGRDRTVKEFVWVQYRILVYALFVWLLVKDQLCYPSFAADRANLFFNIKKLFCNAIY
jgi:hypothetical protein